MQEDQQINLTPRATPLSSRFYLGQPHLATPLHTPLRSQLFYSHQQNVSPQPEGVIYGRNILVNRTIADLKQFLMNFQVTFERDDDYVSQKIYLAKLRDLWHGDSTPLMGQCFDIDAMHLNKYSQNIYLQLVYFPVEIISCFDIALHQLYEKQFIQCQTNPTTKMVKTQRKEELKVGIINLNQKDRSCIQDLAPSKLGRLISLVGMAVRMSEIYPEMKVGSFKCLHCKNIILIRLENARVEEPKTCPKCHRSGEIQLIHNSCQFTNKQYIKFQELLQNVSDGHTPSAVTVIAYDSNVDRIRPGDCVEMTGIYRCHPVRVHRGKSTYRQLFNTYFDVISFEKLEDHDKRIKFGSQHFTEEEKRQFFKISNRDSVIEDLVDSFAPSIYGHREVKKGMLTQLFGGSKKQRPNGSTYRSEINICLVGDPSTAKSQMLIQVHKIAPRSIYTCGRGSSAVGLTANIRKDPDTRQFVLQSGALVLSDKGICCIDQFDKMQKNTRSVLLEVMEQQTISIAKAGIVCQLNSRTSILAAANPIQSKYDSSKSVVQNINLPPALLSRFDLIYIMLDVPNEEEDKKIAAHILDIYTDKTCTPKKEKSTSKKGTPKKESITSSRQGKYSLQLLSNYISFAKEMQPILSEIAGKRLTTQYTNLRAVGISKNTITATPRLLQSMIRLSEAFAKMRLSQQVTVQDVEEAIDLISFATLKSATDPETGIIDMDIITTGRRSGMKKRVQQLAQKIKVILEANQSKYSQTTGLQKFQEDYFKLYPMNKDPVTRDELIQALTILKSEDYIYVFGHDKKKPKFKLQQFNEA